MRIVLFGVSGPTGRALTDQAVAAGHRVTAVTRDAARIGERAGVSVVAADATDRRSVDAALDGGDAVGSILGVGFSRDEITTYSRGTATILAGMRGHGIRRLVTVTSQAVEPDWRPSNAFFFNHVLNPLVNQRLGRTVFADMRRLEALVRDSDADWTVVRPSGLFDHPAVTDYTVAADRADGLYTARADLAASMLARLTDERFVRATMAVITTAVRPNIAKLFWREAIARRR